MSGADTGGEGLEDWTHSQALDLFCGGLVSEDTRVQECRLGHSLNHILLCEALGRVLWVTTQGEVVAVPRHHCVAVQSLVDCGDFCDAEDGVDFGHEGIIGFEKVRISGRLEEGLVQQTEFWTGGRVQDKSFDALRVGVQGDDGVLGITGVGRVESIQEVLGRHTCPPDIRVSHVQFFWVQTLWQEMELVDVDLPQALTNLTCLKRSLVGELTDFTVSTPVGRGEEVFGGGDEDVGAES